MRVRLFAACARRIGARSQQRTHAAGLASSLANLAGYVQQGRPSPRGVCQANRPLMQASSAWEPVKVAHDGTTLTQIGRGALAIT